MSTCIGHKNGVTARKQHACWWCGGAIEPGEKYDRWIFLDGTINEVKCHPECHRAWNHAATHIDTWYYVEEVGFADHRRGCCCERGTKSCDGCGMEVSK